MTHLLMMNGIVVQCGECFKNDDCVEVVRLWSNQHGGAIRVFCHHCKAYTDVKRVGETYTAKTPKPFTWNAFKRSTCKA